MRNDDFCRDPGRRLLYDELLQYFTDEPNETRLAKCKICGEVVPCVTVSAAGEGTCLAQYAIVSKHKVKLSDGEPVALAAKTEKGFNAFNEDNFVLIASRGYGFITSNVPPVKELPAHVVAVRKGTEKISEIRRALFEAPPAPPYVAVIYDGRSGARPVVPVTDPNVVTISGGQNAVTYDRKRFAVALDSARTLGPGAFELASNLRRALLRDGPSGKFKYETAEGRLRQMEVKDAYAELRKLGLPNLQAVVEAVPPADAPTARIIKSIVAGQPGYAST